jgi:hypothetical protein
MSRPLTSLDIGIDQRQLLQHRDGGARADAQTRSHCATRSLTAPWDRRLKAAFGAFAPYWDHTALMWGEYTSTVVEFAMEDGVISQVALLGSLSKTPIT